MNYYLTGKQMQSADSYTIQKIGILSMVLMERAALETVRLLEEESLDFRHTLVVCGSGNNGGDGYAIARLLHLKGYKVSICFVGNEEKRSEENAKQKKIAEYYHIPVVQEMETQEYSIIIDAIFGIGLKRNLEGIYAKAVDAMNRMNGYKVAVDMPSGIHDETGLEMGTAFRADLTIAVAFAKRGQVLISHHPNIGKLRVADIGIYPDAVSTDEKKTYCFEHSDFVKQFPKRKEHSHKGSYGKVLLIAGSKGMSGAALLCARAAYTTGAGLVRIYTHEDNRVIVQEAMPEAMVSAYESYDEETLHALLDWADVVGIGPGLGMSETSALLVRYVLRYFAKPCVADADALNLIANEKELLCRTKASLVLTPHMKEMTRLLGKDMAELQIEKVQCLDAFVKQYPVTCVLKDARTLIAKEGRDIFLNMTGNCAMAKGGSGDVLTGIIAGILAQKVSSYEAACLGVYLHGLAGDEARERKGAYSVLAGDLIESIGRILKQI